MYGPEPVKMRELSEYGFLKLPNPNDAIKRSIESITITNSAKPIEDTKDYTSYIINSDNGYACFLVRNKGNRKIYGIVQNCSIVNCDVCNF